QCHGCHACRSLRRSWPLRRHALPIDPCTGRNDHGQLSCAFRRQLLRTALATSEPVCARSVLLSAECFGQSAAERSLVHVSNSGLYRRSLSKEAGTARLKTDANGGGMATAASGANCAA